MKEKKIKKKHMGIKVLILLCTIAIVAILTYIFVNLKTEQKQKDVMKEIFDRVETTEASLVEYIVYGTHLNIKGEIKDELSNVREVKLLLEGLSGENKNIKLNYERTAEGISFYTSELLNDGIDLETIDIDKYLLLIEVTCISMER